MSDTSDTSDTIILEGMEFERPKCLAFDTMSSIELAIRNWHKFKFNPKAADARQWWGGVTDDIEQFWVSRLGKVKMNMVCLAHVDEDKDQVHGNFVRNPALPGRMRKRFCQAWSEFYHSKIIKDGYVLQTAPGDGYYASTQIGAPNDCPNDFSKIWANWKESYQPPLHIAIYGETGTGKTHFLRSCPKPLLVMFFDGINKELPLVKGGEVTHETDKLTVIQREDGPVYVRFFADEGHSTTMLKHLGDVSAPVTHAKPTAWPDFTKTLHSLGL